MQGFGSEWVQLSRKKQSIFINLVVGGGWGQGQVLLHPLHTGPDWIIRNELTNVTNITSITRGCVTETAWHWDDIRRILKHISGEWPQSDQTGRLVSPDLRGTSLTSGLVTISSGLWRQVRSCHGVTMSGRSCRHQPDVYQAKSLKASQ